MPGFSWRSALRSLAMVLCCCAPMAVAAQAVPSGLQPAVHYHFGDDAQGRLGWAGSNLNDHAWPVAQQGHWPAPPYDSDGFVWVRFRIPVRGDTSEPLAIRVSNPRSVLMADEVFVNGASVGTVGELPPEAWVNCIPQDAIFDVPRGLAPPGTIASVALRLWYPPFSRSHVPNASLGFDQLAISIGRGSEVAQSAAFAFDQRRTLHADEEVDQTRALLRNLPGLILNGLILLIGCTVLLLARSSKSRDLRLYGAMLATFPWITIFFELVNARVISLSIQEYFPLQVISQLPAMIVTVSFIWGINQLGGVWFKRVALAAMWTFNIGMLVAYVPGQPSDISSMASPISVLALQVFNIVTLGANLWVLFVLRRNRLIAFAMTLPPLASLAVGFRVLFQEGQEAFDLAFFLAGLVLSIALAIEAWKEWRARDALRGEFDAAREVQQKLIRPAADVPGFRIESVYAPATQVGGDFFRVVPETDGSVLVVIGDVSGKGLKAALTVSAMIGALRTLPQLSPARMLSALNRGLLGQMQAGFVTCCIARIDPTGMVMLANAGHLPPYCNGEELELASGLPLGLNPDANYQDTTVILAPEEMLTFVSDGVVEARDGSGNLFGFDRTRRISRHSAQEIADEAQRFGQEDDITVLTLAFAGEAVAAVS